MEDHDKLYQWYMASYICDDKSWNAFKKSYFSDNYPELIEAVKELNKSSEDSEKKTITWLGKTFEL